MVIKNTLFYKSLNTLLKERIQLIKPLIDNSLLLIKDKNNKPLKVSYSLENHPCTQVTQWRIEVDFNDYEWDLITCKPFHLGGFISIEENLNRQIVICNFGRIYNSFNSNIEAISHTQITFSDLDNLEIVNSAIKKVNSFLDDFPKSFLSEVNLIDTKKLENI